MAGAGGFEPPYAGIKIRCLTTWLRPKNLGRLSRTPVTGNKTAGNKPTGSAPPARLGGGEGGARRLGRAAVGKERKAGGAAAAQAREQSAGEPGEPGEHGADLGNETNRGVGQVVAARH